LQNGVKNLFLNLTKWYIYDYCAFLERKGYELNGKRREYAEASIFDAASHPDDKALISFLYETDYRKDELINRVIKNVKFDDYGAIVILNGKTGDRSCRIFSSYMLQWVENHPTKENRKCPRCHELNPESSVYCGKCGLPLKEEIQAKIEKDTT
jgi:hypothetical protein